MKDAMSVPDVTKKTSGVALEDLPASSATGRAPPPPIEVRSRVGLNAASKPSLAREDGSSRGGKRLPMLPPLPTKRRREVYDDDDAACRASKKKQVAEPAARGSSTSTMVRPTPQTSRANEEGAPARYAAPRAFRNRKDGERRRSRGSAPAASNLRVPPPAPAPARMDALSAQDALSAVIASARQFQDKQRDIARRREEARRELAEMVRTVEFNDPYISPLDALKP